MNITDEPMPGVAEPGARHLWLIACSGDKIVLLPEAWDVGEGRLERAKEVAVQRAIEFDEVIVIEGVLKYRVWDRDKRPVARPELAMG